MLIRLKQKGMGLQAYINKWNEHAAQLPIQLSDDVAKLLFVENLEDDFHQLANQFRIAHPECTLQDIIQYLRMVNVDGRSRAGRQATPPPKQSTTTPMEVDLAALRAQVADLERQVRGKQEEETVSAHMNRLTAEELKEHMEKNLCFNCHQPGHRSVRCPELKKGKNQRRGNQQKKKR